MPSEPGLWMAQQHQAGRRVCLILEGHQDARQRLLSVRQLSQYCSLYAETALFELAPAGPVIVLVEQADEPGLVDLLQCPEANWGWLGSLPDEDLAGVVRHWRERLLVGHQGSQALYRFHDNRTLARALSHLQSEHRPVLLGPLFSVCYWHEGRWRQSENPRPGEYPVPVPAPWLNTPNPQAEVILHANILRYLLTEHSESLAGLVGFQDPGIWLAQVIEQARVWQWRSPQQLEFLVVRRLEEATQGCAIRWLPIEGEAPGEHFERVSRESRSLGKNMNKRMRSVLVALGAGWLSGCAVAPPVDRFTLELDLPAQFRFIGAANYRPARYELCTLPQRRGKRPERKIFIGDYKPLAERVSYEFPLTETIEGCPSVLRSVQFTLYAKWGELDTDVGGSSAAISFADPIESERVAAMPESGVQAFSGECMWFFRTAGPEHAIRKLLECNALDTKGKRQETRPGGVVQRALLPGKKVRLTLSVTDEEAPAFQDTWLAVPGGWRRCRGKSFEDLSGYCGSNTTDFKPITMPDGRVCDVYPTCN